MRAYFLTDGNSKEGMAKSSHSANFFQTFSNHVNPITNAKRLNLKHELLEVFFILDYFLKEVKTEVGATKDFH